METLRRAAEETEHCPSTQLVCIADSEADIYELLAEGSAEAGRVDWIVRACQNRALQAKNAAESGERHVREHLLAQPVLFHHTIQVRGRKSKVACETRGRRQPRQSRETEVAVRAARVTLRPPRRADRKLPEVSVNAILVRELEAPEDDVAVEWLLLTRLPVEGIDQVRRQKSAYRIIDQIEQ